VPSAPNRQTQTRASGELPEAPQYSRPQMPSELLDQQMQ